jgi:hypothetical protein
MDIEANGSARSAFTQLGLVVGLTCIAASAAVAAMYALAVSDGAAPEAPCSVEVLQAGARHCVRAAPSCNACGTIERVRVVAPPRPAHEVSTVSGGGTEGVALLLGALSGRVDLGPVPLYQVEVRMRDGSVRAFLQAEAPIWRAGDRVRVHSGMLRPLG